MITLPCTFLTWFSKFFLLARIFPQISQVFFSGPGSEACCGTEPEFSRGGGGEALKLASVVAEIGKNEHTFLWTIFKCIFGSFLIWLYFPQLLPVF